jgi:hypothetical protein
VNSITNEKFNVAFNDLISNIIIHKVYSTRLALTKILNWRLKSPVDLWPAASVNRFNAIEYSVVYIPSSANDQLLQKVIMCELW